MGGTYMNTIGYESVSAEIKRRMAAVDLKTLEPPVQPLSEKDHVVGDATDEIKRLFGARSGIADEYNTLANERNGLVTELQALMQGGLGTLAARS